MKNKPRGFTIIELLIVIAIIGILSSIVLTDISNTKKKAANVSVKASLKSIFSAAEIIYNETGVYTGVCSNADIVAAYTAAGIAGGGNGTCNHAAARWAAFAPLKLPEEGGAFWCVDSTGASKAVASQSGNFCQ